MTNTYRLAVAATVAVAAAAAFPAAALAQRPAPAARAATLAPTQAGAWIGLAFSCGDCTVTRSDGERRWVFPTAPEVYSVEQGSPAYRAGMRRGDVLTHVDSQPITSAEGGRRWAALKPGDAARVTYRRDGRAHSVTLRPVEPPSRAAQAVQLNALRASSASSDSALLRLTRQYEVIMAQQKEQEEALLRQVLAERRGAPAEQRQALERITQQYAARQARLRSVQEQQLQELLRLRQTEARQLQGVLTPSRVTAASGGGSPTAAGVRGRIALTQADAQRLRYSGAFGGSDIEVRGIESVVVTEQGDELIIVTRDATIRLRLRDRD